jgi:arabinogalactan oligomer/maltooligosaccharide transport system permease protein
MDAEKAKQQAQLALILAIAGIVAAVVAGVVLFLGPLSAVLKLDLIDPAKPRAAWVNIANLALSVLAIGAAAVGTYLAGKAKEVILPRQAGRKAVETTGVLGWVGVGLSAWTLLYLLALLAPQTKVQLLLGLGEVGQTLLLILFGAVAISGLTYLVLGVLFKSRFALPFTLLAPAIVGLCLLVIYPMGYEVRLAFSNMSLKHFKEPTYSLAEGWNNFKEVFNQPVLKQVMFLPSITPEQSTVNGVTQEIMVFKPGLLLRTFLWTGIQVPAHVLGGLLLALLLNRPMKLRGLYRAFLIIPWALPPIVAILAWRGEFHFEYGFINIMLRGLGLAAVQWKLDPTANFVAMNIVNIWLGIPFMMVILLGGLQSIPGELYEAAEIDGATWWQQFRKITWPLLQPVLTPAIILGVIWTFNNFNVPFFINENELESSDILVTALFRAAFQYNQYGFAAAFAFVIFFILLGFSIVYINSTGALRGVTESAPATRRRRFSLRRGSPKGGSEK